MNIFEFLCDVKKTGTRSTDNVI